mmetsp:Transcript_37113/g.114351  ORF Transcript_37113/g.114351 Transcript_37113/m.114351 type:complete len:216 (-) Transcript_37113:478-1125(-)
MQRRPLQPVAAAEGPQAVEVAGLQRRVRRAARGVLQPGLLQRRLRAAALLRGVGQQLADEALGVVGHALPVILREGVPAGAHAAEDLVLRAAHEGRVAAEQHVHDDAEAPEVRGLVVLAGEHLGGDVVGRARLRRQHLALLELAGEAEVDDLQDVALDGLCRQEDKVLRLQVSVGDVQPVHVAHSSEDLLHDHGRLALREAAGLEDAVEELAAST